MMKLICLWRVLIKHKMMFFGIIFFTTLSGLLYAWVAKPIYKGSVLIEIGEVLDTTKNMGGNTSFVLIELDNITDLKEIITKTTGVQVDIPAKANNLLTISMESSDKTVIQSKLASTIRFIMRRHQEKAKFYQSDDAKVRMTQVVGTMIIDNDPIKPKKRFIVTIFLIMGIFLGIFLAFFREFMRQKETTIGEFKNL